MEELYSLSKNLHVAFICISICFVILNLYLLRQKNPKRKYLAFLPLYYTILACIAFTGAIMINFIGSWLIIAVMISTWLVILIGTIKTYKLLKYTNNPSDDIIGFITKKYYLDFGLFLILLILGRF